MWRHRLTAFFLTVEEEEDDVRVGQAPVVGRVTKASRIEAVEISRRWLMVEICSQIGVFTRLWWTR